MIDHIRNLTGIQRQDIIDLLPFVLMEIRNYTNQYFLTTTRTDVSYIENHKIYVDNTTGFNVGDSIEILNSHLNTIIYQVKNVENDYIEVEQDLLNEHGVKNVVVIKLSFRGVSINTVSNMVSYSKNTMGQGGVQSQSLGGYSVTYSKANEGMTAYPLELYGGVNALRKLHDDYAEYRRKGYVRLL